LHSTQLCCGLAAGGDAAGDDEVAHMLVLVLLNSVLISLFVNGVVDGGQWSTNAAVIRLDDRGLVDHVDLGGAGNVRHVFKLWAGN
jgi:hypothetical protein